MSSPNAPSPHAAGAGIPLIITTLLSWASIPLFLTWFVSSMDAWEANGWRYGLSALFWLPLLAAARARAKLPSAIFVAALIPAAFNLVGQTCFAWCPYYLDPGFFTFVFRVQIVFVTVGAYFLFPSEHATLRSPRFWAGVALVVCGSVGLILLRSPAPPSETGSALSAAHAAHASNAWFGIPLAIAASGLFAGYALSVRKFMHAYPPVLAFGVICQYTACGTVILMLVLGHTRGQTVLGFSGFQWFMLVSSSMIGIAISHVLYYAAIARLGVAVSMGIIQLQPILTAAASMFLFGERLNAYQWLCGLVGVAGAVLILAAGRKVAADGRRARELEADRAQAEAVTDAGA